MKIENERKLLLKRLPSIGRKWYDDLYDISQWYLEDGTRYRKSIDILSGNIMEKEYKYERVKKEKTGKSESRIEDIQQLTKEEYEDGIEDAVSVVHKARYVKYFDGYKIEIDSFINIKLVVCEIEILSDALSTDVLERLNSIELPEFLQDEVIMEVTEFDEFENENLAISIL